MADDLSDFIAASGPPAGRPLQGLTVLLVEDSRFACEAMRLMCQRSGARLRRADCLRSARRHLQAYRPTVAIVDLGLPDGSGLDLIHDIAAMSPRVPALLGTSGESGAEGAARAAGADGFLAKPVESLAGFQRTVLAALPAGAGMTWASRGPEDRVDPDPLALRDDLARAAELLGRASDGATLDYVAQFLSGLARSARDAPLQAAAEALARDGLTGLRSRAPVSRVSGLVRDRLAAGARF
ncbi:response regulator [Defluviimonas sp. D31]|uniref:response regulator n=1 Tax=Defluviimonas sp. D31 TaxID=3083253 RepID=UPI00296F7DFE|nr:response regulator [Defluviimonas sp. D31]MDW4549570.1 response regulator [Defluviimonas sp. D31]